MPEALTVTCGPWMWRPPLSPGSRRPPPSFTDRALPPSFLVAPAWTGAGMAGAGGRGRRGEEGGQGAALPSPLLSPGPWEPGLRGGGGGPQTGNASLGSYCRRQGAGGRGLGRVSRAGGEGAGERPCMGMGHTMTHAHVCVTQASHVWSPPCPQGPLPGPGRGPPPRPSWKPLEARVLSPGSGWSLGSWLSD